MTDIGLVLQGGGALGSYEWGAVTCLVEAGFVPRAISGVSIGAINAAATAGAKGGDIIKSLERIWAAITLPEIPFLLPSQQTWLSAFGDPGFYRLRTDYLNAPNWTSLCDVSPMRQTLRDLLDFDRLNDTRLHQVTFTATNIGTGESTRFSNRDRWLEPDHILASGSLPPGFPPTMIDGASYWDGGLFDNTPLRPVIEMLTPAQRETMPVFVVDLFPNGDAVPKNLPQVQARMTQIAYENKSWDDYGGPQGMRDYAAMLRAVDEALPDDSPLKQDRQYQRLMEYQGLANLHVVSAPHEPMTGGADFSEYGVKQRRDTGYRAMTSYLEANGLRAVVPRAA